MQSSITPVHLLSVETRHLLLRSRTGAAGPQPVRQPAEWYNQKIRISSRLGSLLEKAQAHNLAASMASALAEKLNNTKIRYDTSLSSKITALNDHKRGASERLENQPQRTAQRR